jgi:N-acetylglucosamine-6-sulfatase
LSEDDPETGHSIGVGRHRSWIRAAAAFAAAVALAACSGFGAADTKPPTPTVPIGTMASRPNIVFVLTDDLSSNLVDYMPHVRSMMQRGATFTSYFVTDSLCCPSRASIFTGLYPHSSGVYTNTAPEGGLSAFDRLRNPSRTFAVALQQRGYRTALFGKYLNGYEPNLPVPEGWDDWAVAGNGGYGEYIYRLNQNGRVVGYRAYLTDVLSRLAQRYIAGAAMADDGSREPFALEIATFAPHPPFVPAPRDGHRFPRVRAPRTPEYDRKVRGAGPSWLDLPPLRRDEVTIMDDWFRRRVQSVQAIDSMVSTLQREVREQGLASNTYFVFSSDNGYHIGEHRLRPGKMTAFDTDIRVPLVVVGPGIQPGMRIDALAENIDLAPTFEELAGHASSPAVEGRSLVPLLEGRQPEHWRRAAFVEHRGPDVNPADPDFPDPESGNPPSYKAIRFENALYVEYVDGEHEYYDLAADPFELRNVYADLGRARRAQLHRYVVRFARCHGAALCHRADQLLPPPSKPRSTPTTFRPSTARS